MYVEASGTSFDDGEVTELTILFADASEKASFEDWVALQSPSVRGWFDANIKWTLRGQGSYPWYVGKGICFPVLIGDGLLAPFDAERVTENFYKTFGYPRNTMRGALSDDEIIKILKRDRQQDEERENG